MGKRITVELDAHEAVHIVDSVTGEVKKPKVVEKKSKLRKWQPNQKFYKTYPTAWRLLETQVTPSELKVAMKLSLMAKPVTNTLRPLNPETTTTQLADILNQNRNTIRKIIDKLFDLGVLGQYAVSEVKNLDPDRDYGVKELSQMDSEIRRYWLFNPYLSFNGSHIHEDIPHVFRDTYYAKVSN